MLFRLASHVNGNVDAESFEVSIVSA